MHDYDFLPRKKIYLSSSKEHNFFFFSPSEHCNFFFPPRRNISLRLKQKKKVSSMAFRGTQCSYTQLSFDFEAGSSKQNSLT